MRNKKSLKMHRGIGLLIMGLLVSALAFGQPHGNRRGIGKGIMKCPYAHMDSMLMGPGMGKCNISKDLTADQLKKIESSRLQLQKEIIPLKAQIKEKKAHLQSLNLAEKTDQEAINRTIDEISVLKASIQKKQNAHKLEVRTLLTDEQKVRFDSRPMKRCHGQKMHPPE